MCLTWPQVQLSMAQGELDNARKTARRTAAENEALRARIGCFEAASRDKQQALQRAQSDLAFCANIEKQQLWSSLSESKHRIITLQVRTVSPSESLRRVRSMDRLMFLCCPFWSTWLAQCVMIIC